MQRRSRSGRRTTVVLLVDKRSVSDVTAHNERSSSASEDGNIGLLGRQERASERVMSGMRPTGRLHLGHLFGTLAEWLRLQQRHDAFFEIADLHALTTGFSEPHRIAALRRDMVLDWLAVGIDPQRATIFLQSGIREISELAVLLGMITPLAWLQRVPTFKDQVAALGPEIATYGFLGYPLLQLSDIAIFRAAYVPVGRDQLAHLELGREIIRRFQHLYGGDRREPILIEPQPILSDVPEVPGIDGRKMSKSYQNALSIADEPTVTQQRVLTMLTDPQKVRRHDPGRPEICPVFTLHRLVNGVRLSAIEPACRAGELGCVACKQELAASINAHLAPIRERRSQLAMDPTTLDRIIDEGTERAQATAATTMRDVRSVMAVGLTS